MSQTALQHTICGIILIKQIDDANLYMNLTIAYAVLVYCIMIFSWPNYPTALQLEFVLAETKPDI